jgi:hypothetical protein
VLSVFILAFFSLFVPFFRTAVSRGRFLALDASVLLPAFLEVLGEVLFLDLLDDVPHLDGVVDYGIFFGFFVLHDLEHGIFVEELEILTFSVGYFLLEDVFAIILISRFGCLFAGEELLIGLLLLDLVAPVVHPLHTVEMRARNESCLNLDAFKFIVMLLF